MEKTFEEVWQNCLEIIKDNVNQQSFKTWFDPIRPVKLNDNVLTIQVPSQFFYEWLEEHYIDLLKKTINKELGPDGRLEYSIIMENNLRNANPYTVNIPAVNSKSLKNPPVAMPIDLNSSTIKNPFILPGLKKMNVESQLNPNYSFDHLVEGDFNRLARSAGFAVSNKPGGTAFNPLLIYGGVGLGKTHLANAIGIEIKKNFPNKTVLYVQADRFITQYTDSIRNNSYN
ncbi:MAG: chromosomal replication initiator protein DnaA, partial [Bacteroidia bacterium]|nr:chromosomal replication initiator protein DnaA [Bacteroidia bacterium]